MERSILKRLLALFALGVAVVGTGATLYWILAVEDPTRLVPLLPAAAVGFGLLLGITLLNLGLRWVRWHYLTRQVRMGLTTRESLLIFLGTLPAILTPFYLGELLRALLVGRLRPGARSDVVYIWLIERSSDLLAVALLLMVGRGEWLAATLAALLWLGVVGAIRSRRLAGGRAPFPRLDAIATLLSLTALSSALPPVALWWVLGILGAAPPFFDALGIYAYTALLGNLSGLPVGVSVTGSSLVLELREVGVPLAETVVATWVFRAATVWFAVAFGALVAAVYRRSLLAMLRRSRTPDHFDALADSYEVQIPDHVRRRLVERKTRVMCEHLARREGRLRGLDVGCGPGWYACEMARSGYAMSAVEESGAQLEAARGNAARTGVALELKAAKAARLPFPDAHFDFAYAINVLHHMPDHEAQRCGLAEIVRVLVPGGVFFLQEINTDNPLYRLYMNYVFPLIRAIDQGTEQWISPSRLPVVSCGSWQEPIDYFTFLPDFAPELLQRGLGAAERRLERSRLRTWSAHYAARLVRSA